jgi:hypothetical protein
MPAKVALAAQLLALLRENAQAAPGGAGAATRTADAQVDACMRPGCGAAAGNEGVKMRRCGGCGVARYCGKACQATA